ncbi:FAD/NAD(P)-binding domain-containing protein [Pluteus cervinus]|uniref:FAD/NAD(P)-binding domain-containing protein n=1 Tax=Pluteus cervinus TaxID=181527 RepID=A0ACD3AYN6_9AGAR|nr:FAD/NAD(P)-binding domain-containing protein [Pluteus cervinus]
MSDSPPIAYATGVVRPRRILVIGGGPTGLVTHRNLTQRGSFDRVELVERRDDVGGAWYLDQPIADPNDGTVIKVTNKPRWPSPAYPGLVGNVLPHFLSYSGHPSFPETKDPKQPFPSLWETHAYLRGFAKPFVENGSIRLNMEVVKVEEQDEGKGWKITMKDWNDGKEGKVVEEFWDAVVVANGWYDTPLWPDTEGVDILKEAGLAKHAKWWRGQYGFGYEGKKVLVVGNANSGNDMAAQLSTVVKSPVYQSVRRPNFPGFPALADEKIQKVAPVLRYTLSPDADSQGSDSEGRITAELTDGTKITGIDLVFFGTGYKHRADFVRILDVTNPTTEGSQNLVPITADEVQPHRVPSLHRHILYAHNPSLAFIGSTLAYTPFTIADLGSTWLTLAWLGEIPYPQTPSDRLAYERERLSSIEQLRSQFETPSTLYSYNVLAGHEQTYGIMLKEDVVQARPELKDVLPEWSDDRTKLREAMFKTKVQSLEYTKELRKRQGGVIEGA